MQTVPIMRIENDEEVEIRTGMKYGHARVVFDCVLACDITREPIRASMSFLFLLQYYVKKFSTFVCVSHNSRSEIWGLKSAWEIF